MISWSNDGLVATARIWKGGHLASVFAERPFQTFLGTEP